MDEGLINVISLVRFICFVFLFGKFGLIQDAVLLYALHQSKNVIKYWKTRENMGYLHQKAKPEDLNSIAQFKKTLTISWAARLKMR